MKRLWEHLVRWPMVGAVVALVTGINALAVAVGRQLPRPALRPAPPVLPGELLWATGVGVGSILVCLTAAALLMAACDRGYPSPRCQVAAMLLLAAHVGPVLLLVQCIHAAA